MAFPADQIRALISDGETEKALVKLIEGLQSIKSARVDEAILLKSQWEHIERDMTLNLISSEEAARRVSQINFAALKLLANPTQEFSTPSSPSRKRNLPLSITIGIIIVAVSVFLIRNSAQKTLLEPINQKQSRQSQTTEQPTVKSNVAERLVDKLTAITFPKDTLRRSNTKGMKVNFILIKGEISPDPADSYKQKVQLWLRCQVPGNSKTPYTFGTDNFRLLANNINHLPTQSFQVEVQPGTFQGRILQFSVPKEVRNASLRNLAPNLTIPLEW